MPLPDPGDFDSKDAYMRACMREQKNADRKHAAKVAACLSKWKKGRRRSSKRS